MEACMFHTYVLNFHRVPIDIDRSVFLMDKKIWLQVLTDLRTAGEKDPQIFFCEYSERHEGKYGRPFGPMVMKEPL